MNPLKIVSTIVFCLSVFMLPLSLPAQVSEMVTDESGHQTMVTRFKITPKKLEQPLLKYSLVWKSHETVPGNAAYYYEQAYSKYQDITARRASRNAEGVLAKIWDRAAENKPIDREFLKENTFPHFLGDSDTQGKTPEEIAEIEKDSFVTNWRSEVYSYSAPNYYENFEKNYEEAKEFVEEYAEVFRLMELGSRCAKYELGFSSFINTVHSENYEPLWNSFGIDEMRHARELARVLTVKIRLEIHEKRYTDAVASLRVGLQLSRHLGEQPELIYPLVGISIQGIMYSSLYQVMECPDAPNLYWAISHKPNPHFTLWMGFFDEMSYYYHVLPILKKAMETPEKCNDSDWKLLLEQMEEALVENFKDMPDHNEDGVELPAFLKSPDRSLALEKANAWLKSQEKTDEEIKELSEAKAIGLHLVYDTKMLRDEFFKTVYLPLGEQIEDETLGAQKVLGENAIVTSPYVHLFAEWFFSSIHAGRRAYARAQTYTDMFRLREAIALHIAENDGKLPEKLEEITAVTLPCVNPFTGKPYEYEFKDGKGVIEIPQQAPPGRYIFEKATK